MNTAKLSSSNIIMYVLPIIVTPILSRLYSPTCFGEWGVFSSIITIATIVIFMSYENTIVKAKEEEMPVILTICGLIGCGLAIMFTLLIFCIEKAHIFNTNIGQETILFALYFIAYILYTIAYNISNRYSKYTSLSVANILQGVSQAFFRITLAFMTISAFNGLIVGTTMAEILTAGFLAYIVLRLVIKYNWSSCTLKNIKRVVLKYKKFPLYDAPANLLAFSALSLPTIILAAFYTKSAIGSLSIIFQLLLMPMSLVGSSLGKVYYQELCQKDTTQQKIAETTNTLFRFLGILAILPLLFICCGGDQIIVCFLGEGWETAGDIAICLSLWSFPIVLTQPLLPIFRVLNVQNVQLRYDIIYFIAGIGVLTVCSINSISLTTTLFCYALACTLSKLALLKKIISLTHSRLLNRRILLFWTICILILMVRLYNL